MPALSDLERYIHADSDLPALMKIGLIHAQFETIHPFLDGNGRVGRLLITFLLCANEILIKPVLYISHFFRENRSQYYERLQRIRDHGEWEQWLEFFLDGVGQVSLEATETARRIVQLREDSRNRIVSSFGRAAGRGLLIFESLFERPVITVSNIAKFLAITFPAANALVDRFVEARILREITGQKRYRVFSFEQYIDLFSDKKGALPND
jgi:Fic family protein